jgi:hypothetical protein
VKGLAGPVSPPIPVEDLTRKWLGKPAFCDAYDALEDQFALAEALSGRGRKPG